MKQPHDTPSDTFAKSMKGKTGFGRIKKAFGYSCDGFLAAYRGEAAFRQVVWLNAVLCLLLCFLPFALTVKMLLIIISAVSVIVELFNTGLEAVVDRISDEYHPLSKVAKDVGSAAQFLTLCVQCLLWALAIFSTIL